MVTHVSNGIDSELEALRQQFVPAAYRIHHPVVAASSEGAWVTDVTGRRLLDFAGGIAVANIGNRHPSVVAAIHRQADRLLHSGPVTLHEGYIRLSAKLAERAPGQRSKQVLLVNSGAEAIENAVRLARYATGRTSIVAFDRAFHGRTALASTLTGKARPYKTQPGPGASEIYHVPFPDTYRPPRGVPASSVVDYCLGALDDLLMTRVPAEKIAAVIVEPVQGEGGYIVPPRGFLPAVQEWCRRIGALLIVDEIQTGFGRTGALFASEHEGLSPDIIAVGKSLGGGLPIGAVIAATEHFDKVEAGGIGGTYGGNPVACAAALAVLEAFDDVQVMEKAVTVGVQTRTYLERLKSERKSIGDVRGLGAMLAIELVTDQRSNAPAAALTDQLLAAALDQGLLLIKTGMHANVVRVLPPLVIDDQTLHEGLKRLGMAAANSLAPRAA